MFKSVGSGVGFVLVGFDVSPERKVQLMLSFLLARAVGIPFARSLDPFAAGSSRGVCDRCQRSLAFVSRYEFSRLLAIDPTFLLNNSRTSFLLCGRNGVLV